MEALSPNGQESLEKANEEDLNFNNKHHLEKPHTTGEHFYTTDNEVKMNLNKILISDKVHSNNNIYNSYEETFAEFDDNFRFTFYFGYVFDQNILLCNMLLISLEYALMIHHLT